MNFDNGASSDMHSFQSGVWRCEVKTGVFMRMAHRHTSSPYQSSARKTLPHVSEDLAEEAARAFEQMSGYATLTARAGESAALADLLTRGGSFAAVILMDTDVLGHVYPRCNWKTPLLRLRNRLGGDGATVFAALALSSRGGTVSATRARAANGMMTILRGTIVQDLMWTKGYGAVRGMLSFPSNVAKGVAPIAAASIWNFTHGYVAVEWTVFLVSILSVTAFFLAVRVSRHATTGVA